MQNLISLNLSAQDLTDLDAAIVTIQRVFAPLITLQADEVLTRAFGAGFIDYFTRIKQSERDRHAQAEDKADFERREYFSRY